MLNPFPILYLAMLGHFILRAFVGFILLHYGIKHIQVRHDMKHVLGDRVFPFKVWGVWWFASVEIILAIMFIFGIYTQIAALCGMVFAVKMLLLYRHVASEYLPGPTFYVLLFGVSLSLFITGAGAFGFDLPV